AFFPSPAAPARRPRELLRNAAFRPRHELRAVAQVAQRPIGESHRRVVHRHFGEALVAQPVDGHGNRLSRGLDERRQHVDRQGSVARPQQTGSSEGTHDDKRHFGPRTGSDLVWLVTHQPRKQQPTCQENPPARRTFSTAAYGIGTPAARTVTAGLNARGQRSSSYNACNSCRSFTSALRYVRSPSGRWSCGRVSAAAAAAVLAG